MKFYTTTNVILSVSHLKLSKSINKHPKTKQKTSTCLSQPKDKNCMFAFLTFEKNLHDLKQNEAQSTHAESNKGVN